MSSSDARMFDALEARVNALEAAHAVQEAAFVVLREQLAALLPRPMGETLYGSEPDHGADREARAALLAKRRDR